MLGWISKQSIDQYFSLLESSKKDKSEFLYLKKTGRKKGEGLPYSYVVKIKEKRGIFMSSNHFDMNKYAIISPLIYAEDDEDDRMFFEEAMQEIYPDIEMKLFANGKILIDYFTDLSAGALPKLIFLDLNMPVMNGTECLAELNKAGLTARIPVVIYTTSSTEEERLKLLDMGATSFLTKETSVERMHSQLRNLIDSLNEKGLIPRTA
ncbi:response regulator [Euzebyella marina]|uniref:Response regulator n=2 Tax=Bacteroidota/Chlorobiota group TaxID=68336 RepID=A0A3G2L5K9_9FLAO|nr:response regulator [Euzebyella marina]